jgi:hypothetical protein
VTTPGKEFTSIQVPKNTTDRLISTSVQPAKLDNAMRVEVKPNDVAHNAKGDPIKSGWRAEAIGPYETETSSPVGYTWSTRLDPAYVDDPRDSAGKRIWQVIFQWHQGDNDRGVEPPIAFTIIYDNIMLDLHRHDPLNQDKSIKVGEWPVARLDRGSWHDFAAEIRWHQGQGTIRVWHNGVPYIFNPQGQHPYPAQPTDILTGLDTLFPPKTSTKPSESYMKVGLYRKGVDSFPAGPFVLYHDEITRWEGDSSCRSFALSTG